VRAEHVATVGDVVVSRVAEYEQIRAPEVFFDDSTSVRQALADEPWLQAFTTPADELRLMIQAFVVETADTVILVDPCIGDDRSRTRLFLDKPSNTTFLQDLSDLVGDLRRIETVAFTHLHVDHVGWSTSRSATGWDPVFPWARHVIAGSEWEHWRAVADTGTVSDFTLAIDESIRPLFEHDLVALVDGDVQLAPGVRLRDTSGHSAGHVSMHLESRGARALITGDVLHHPVEVYEPSLTKRAGLDLDPSRAVRARVELVDELTDREVLMIGTHFASGCAGFVERGSGGRRRFRTIADTMDS
jgi:glyoxylase-like metal-dependent hydrolase (beta-lactamase superfamily II)